MFQRQYTGKTVAVFGLARSGLAVVDSLRAAQARVLAWDEDLDRLATVKQNRVEVRNLFECDFNKIDSLVVSPGVPLTNPSPHSLITLAQENNCEVIGDIELFFRAQISSLVIGVTGTNGKSTVTALLNHVLRENGMTVQMGGNIGTPVLALEKLADDGFYIIEVSSYQIDLAPSLNFDISVLLNISPDHLDRHGDMGQYVAIKKRIFDGNLEKKIAIVSIDDPYCLRAYDELAKKTNNCIPISIDQRCNKGVSVIDGALYDDLKSNLPVLDINGIETLRGKHNWQNSAAVYAIASKLGLSSRQISTAFKTYKGLPHRLETVAKSNGLEFVNDSKATNVNATVNALSSFSTVYWIAGGQQKEKNLSELFPLLTRVRHVYTIGEAGKVFFN